MHSPRSEVGNETASYSLYRSIWHVRLGLTGCLLLWLVTPLAAATIELDTTQSGGTYDPGDYELSISHPSNNPLFTLTDGAQTTEIGTVTVGFLDNEEGRLRIEGGSTLTNFGYGSLGYGPNSTGTATVTGPGSTWKSIEGMNSFSLLHLGYEGTGVLNIEAGGKAMQGAANLGIASAGYGAATVTGVGSKWEILGNAITEPLTWIPEHIVCTNPGPGQEPTCTFIPGYWLTEPTPTIVGQSGHGKITVADGGLMTIGENAGSPAEVGNTYLGYETGAQGELLVTGTNSTWDASTDLIVGEAGTGDLRVEAGGLVKNRLGILGNSAGGEGTATVTGAGSKWENSGTLAIGKSGTGELIIEDGGQVSSAEVLSVGTSSTGELRIESGGTLTSGGGLLGQTSFGHGTATVTGAGSNWQSQGFLWIGEVGTGDLLIEDGGEVFSTGSALGAIVGSTGSATVTGTDSKWTNHGSLFVGGARLGHLPGTGTLLVENGGEVITDTLYAAPADLQGNGTITAHGAVLGNVDLVFDSTHGLQQTLPFGSGGQLHLNIDGTGALGAGHNGSGSLTIADGMVVTSTEGILGFNISSGTGTITGAGSKWVNTGNLRVGDLSSSELLIETGGEVTSVNGSVVGMATVTGTGSMWANSGTLSLGRIPTSMVVGIIPEPDGDKFAIGPLLELPGLLLVEEGGTVSRANAIIQFGSIATVTGDGSKWENAGSLVVTEGSQLLIEDAGVVMSSSSSINRFSKATVSGNNSKWQNSGSLSIGSTTLQPGELIIEDNGLVTSAAGTIISGTATVTGVGSLWQNSGVLALNTLPPGAGSLIVSSGGTVTAGTLRSALSDLYGDGTITAHGAVLSGVDLVFDSTHGLQQTIPFGTGGQLHVDIDGTGELGAGYRGTSSLTIADGVVVNSTQGLLGFMQGSQGTATVTGAGSSWVNAGALNLGNTSANSSFVGAGILNIEAGGTVLSSSGVLSRFSSVTVTGANSSWQNSGSLDIGPGGASGPGAQILVEADGVLSNVDGTVYGSSSVKVTGANSEWNNSGRLWIGNTGSSGLSVLDIEAGGLVTSDSGRLAGPSPSQTAIVTVTGENSSWINTGNLNLGVFVFAYLNGPEGQEWFVLPGGAASSVVKEGGYLEVGGTLTLAPASTFHLEPGGTLKTNALNFGPSTIDHPGNDVAYLGGTFNFTGGTLLASGEVNGDVIVPTGGVVGGTGTFTSLTIGPGGAVSPGSSPGTQVALVSDWQAGGKYIWEINATAGAGGSEGNLTGWDLFNITDSLSISALTSDPFLIELHSLDSGNSAGLLAGFNSNSSYSWLIATAGDGAFADLDLTALEIDASLFMNELSGGFFGLQTQNGGTELLLTFTSLNQSSATIPEPTTHVLLLIGWISLYGARIRRRITRPRH